MSPTRRGVHNFIEALNSGDPERVVACVAPDFHNEHTSSLGESLHGRDAYRGRLPEFFRQFEGLHYEPEATIVDGDRAAVPYRMTFRWLGTERRPTVAIRGVFLFRVACGLVAHRVDYWDSAEFRRQVETTPAADD